MNGDDTTPQDAPTGPETTTADSGAPEGGDTAGPTAEAAPAGPITDALRQAFSDYLDKSGAREQYGDQVNIDLDFLKHHAGPMFASMFQQLTAKIVPKDMKLEVPVNPPESQPDRKPVAVNFDLASILGSFFAPKPRGDAPPAEQPSEPAPAAEPSPAPQKDEEPPTGA